MEIGKSQDNLWNGKQARSSHGIAADPWWMKIEGNSVSDVEDLYDHFHLSQHHKALGTICKRAQPIERHVQVALSKLDSGDRQKMLAWQRHVGEYVSHREHLGERYARKVELGQTSRPTLLESPDDEDEEEEEDEEDEEETASADKEDAEKDNMVEDKECVLDLDSLDPASNPSSPTSPAASQDSASRAKPPSIRTAKNRLRIGLKVVSLSSRRNSEVASPRQSVTLPSVGEGNASPPNVSAVSASSLRTRRHSDAGKGLGDDAVIAGSPPRRRLSNVGRGIVEDASIAASSGRAKLSAVRALARNRAGS